MEILYKHFNIMGSTINNKIEICSPKPSAERFGFCRGHQLSLCQGENNFVYTALDPLKRLHCCINTFCPGTALYLGTRVPTRATDYLLGTRLVKNEVLKLSK